MQDNAKVSLNKQLEGMNHLDHRESYITFRSPSIYCSPRRLDGPSQGHPYGLDNNISLVGGALVIQRVTQSNA